MPRKHTPAKHTPYQPASAFKTKRRFRTKREAEDFAEQRMLEHPELTLHVYQDVDGGWYLTSSQRSGS